MERLSEDELMCIMQYVPTGMLGVSNERLYDEIRLLDPTFDMRKLYYQLLEWKTKYDTIVDTDSMRIYKTINEHDKYSMGIRERRRTRPGPHGNHPTGMPGMGYTVYGVDNIPLSYSQARDVMRIGDIMLSHPLILPRYYGHYEPGYDDITHTYVFKHYSPHRTIVSSPTYEDDVYAGILALDSDIDMNMLYQYTVDKVEREKSSNRYRRALGSLVQDINFIEGEDDKSFTIFWKGKDHPAIDPRVLDALPEEDGWVHDAEGGYRHSMYAGSDFMDVMRDIVLIDRINGDYVCPPTLLGGKPLLAK
jgi:hypothetical protein